MKTPETQKFDLEMEKIPHPYKVPDNFFNEFKKELLENISEETNTKKSRIIQLFKKSLQYAAILAFSFFALKGIIETFSGKQDVKKTSKTDMEIELIYNQISEEELTEFIVDESNVEISEILDF
jgi:hypothetical protein